MPGDLPLLQRLLRDGADPEQAAPNGLTPLAQTVAQGRTRQASIPDVPQRPEHRAPLRVACRSSQDVRRRFGSFAVTTRRNAGAGASLS